MVTQKQSEFRRNKNENSNELVRLESSLLLNSTECIAVAGDHGKLMPRRKYHFRVEDQTRTDPHNFQLRNHEDA